MASHFPVRQWPLLFIFVTCTLTGVLLALFVYQQGQSTLRGLNEMTEQSLPHYQSIERVTALLSDYERLIYQYHTDQAAKTKEEALPADKAEIQRLLEQISDVADSAETHAALVERIGRIFTLGEQIIVEVDMPVPDWYTVRLRLAALTGEREAAWRDLASLAAVKRQQVEANRQGIFESVSLVNLSVLAFGLLILVCSVLIWRTLQNYVRSSAGMARLALYPQRNPNPVFSLDEQQNVTFINPAGCKYLPGEDVDSQSILALMPGGFGAHLQRAKVSDSGSVEFEFDVEHSVFVASLHWHADQGQWDCHLRDITEKRRAEERLKHQAYHDPETGLANSYQLAESLATFVQNNKAFLFGVIRIRGLSHVRSMEGEMEVVALKQELAEVLRGLTKRRSDAEVFHLSDSEFAVLACKDCQQQDALELVRDIRRQAVDTRFNQEINLRLEFGFAAYPDDGDSMDVLLRNARIMLNQEQDVPTEFQVLVYSEEMRQKRLREKQLVEGMHRALQDNAFQLYFQPQQRLRDRRIVGSEALLRWQHEGNWISPAEFIPLAERSELILQIDQWVLENAFKASRELIDRELPKQVVAINISPRQFSQLDFLTTLNHLTGFYRVPPHCIGLEITEGVMINNMADSMTAMLNLKESGFHLALDDFGTGYSSLSYLHNFPITKLKIDQSFIRHFLEDANLQAIVGSIVELGQNLGIKVIAEGVETKAELMRLSTMGCHEIQGYYLSKPLPFDDYVQLLDTTNSKTG